MKVKIGNYKYFFGPYQLADMLCFWARKKPDNFSLPEYPDWVHKFGDLLAYGVFDTDSKPKPIRELKKTLLHRFLLWIDSFRKQKISVRIDPWDTWGMDSTLSHIILPMLKQLKATKHGSPWVDNEDAPEHIHGDEDEHEVNDKHHERWEYVLNEMIFSFEAKSSDNWGEQFYSSDFGIKFEEAEEDSKLTRPLSFTGEIDTEGLKAYQSRISNGFRLFGKYYESLWD